MIDLCPTHNTMAGLVQASQYGDSDAYLSSELLHLHSYLQY